MVQRIPLASGLAVAVLGVSVLAGWVLAIEPLKTALPGLVSMKLNTAAALVLAGLALAARSLGSRAAAPLSVAVGAVGGLTLLEYATGLDLGIDELIARDPSGSTPPGRMSPVTATALVLFAAYAATERRPRWAGLLLAGIASIAYASLLGYVFDAAGQRTPTGYTPVALHTALALLTLAAGGLALEARDERGFALLRGRTRGAALARQLLVVAVAAPAAIGWLRIAGEDAGWYSGGTGIAVGVIATTFVFAAFLGKGAAGLDTAERDAADANRALAHERARVDGLNRDLERIVAQRTAALAQANADLESFAYSVSHDLRAPLRAVDGFSVALERMVGDSLGADTRHYVQRVREGVERMNRLIDDLLALSLTDRAPLDPRPLDVTALTREAVAECRESDPKRDVAISVADGMQVTADADLMRSVIQNLVSNAWKYTRRTPAPRIDVETRRYDGWVELSVNDNGVGFDTRYADRLFKPFQRLHRAEDYEGTGIGLATVARIARRHGGDVSAASEPGVRTTFSVRFPDGGVS